MMSWRPLQIATLTDGALCPGLLSGRMTRERQFDGDDLRQSDPKFQQPRFDQYLEALKALDLFAREHYSKDLMALSLACAGAHWPKRAMNSGSLRRRSA
jgi:aryl-alcohol dehydrogenase-like predicted oxidoreductase